MLLGTRAYIFIYGLFNGSTNTSDCIALNREHKIGNDKEGSSYGLICGSVSAFAWRD
jgi:hypothetical protein